MCYQMTAKKFIFTFYSVIYLFFISSFSFLSLLQNADDTLLHYSAVQDQTGFKVLVRFGFVLIVVEKLSLNVRLKRLSCLALCEPSWAVQSVYFSQA